jgi:hypothetical protein
VPVFVFFPVFEFCRKGIPNCVQTEWNLRNDFSWTRRQPGDLEMKSEEPRGSHKDGGHAQGGRARPPPLWAPRAPPDLILLPIYSPISPNHQRHPQKHFSTAATFCSHEIPSWDLFRHRRRGNRSRRASTSTLLPFRWSVSSLPQTYGSIAISQMACSLSLTLNTMFSLMFLEIYPM